MTDLAAAPLTIHADEGEQVRLATLGVRFLLSGLRTGGGFSLVEHPLGARQLAAPLHRHHREDEYSFVLEGRFGAIVGEEVLEGGPGTLLCKPRGIWHTFWNAGDEPCRILEIIAPAGFEHFFDELGDLLQAPDFSPEQLGALGAKYGLEFQPEHTQEICEEHGLEFPQL